MSWAKYWTKLYFSVEGYQDDFYSQLYVYRKGDIFIKKGRDAFSSLFMRLF